MDNVEVKITVKVDGKRVARRKLQRPVNSLEDGAKLLHQAHNAVDAIAHDLRNQAGV